MYLLCIHASKQTLYNLHLLVSITLEAHSTLSYRKNRCLLHPGTSQQPYGFLIRHNMITKAPPSHHRGLVRGGLCPSPPQALPLTVAKQGLFTPAVVNPRG